MGLISLVLNICRKSMKFGMPMWMATIENFINLSWMCFNNFESRNLRFRGGFVIIRSDLWHALTRMLTLWQLALYKVSISLKVALYTWSLCFYTRLYFGSIKREFFLYCIGPYILWYRSVPTRFENFESNSKWQTPPVPLETTKLYIQSIRNPWTKHSIFWIFRWLKMPTPICFQVNAFPEKPEN